MRERTVEQTFSGYRLNLPEGLTLTVRDNVIPFTVVDLSDDLSYWMRQSFTSICNQLIDNRFTIDAPFDASY